MSYSFTSYFLLSFLSFIKHVYGVIFKPYETYRDLTKAVYPFEAVFLGFFILIYILIASVLRKGMSSGPLFLTLHFGKILWGIFFTFVFSWGAIYFAGKLVKGKGTALSLFLPWVYSLLPTLIWFILTSLFYFFLPPPRTTAFTGQLFSLFFIAVSLALFYWKGVCYYLTLRLGHMLDLKRIILVSLIIFPLGIIYSLITYKLGLFKIPFI